MPKPTPCCGMESCGKCMNNETHTQKSENEKNNMKNAKFKFM